MRTLLGLTFVLLLDVGVHANDSVLGTPYAACFGAGAGPTTTDGVHHLLDEAHTPSQSNAIAFDRLQEGAFDEMALRAEMRVMEGGDGGSFLFLDTAHHGIRGPAPFLASAVEPNLEGTFAVGIDVHNPPSEETFTPWGNYQDLPQREISLHWDGREIVKRVAPAEFRSDFAEVEIRLRHVTGGAEATVRIAGGAVYDAYFLPGLLPYEMRLAIAAGTRENASTEFDVQDLALTFGPPAAPRRAPLEVEVFHHVMTDNQKTAYEAEVDRPPGDWGFGRVILTLDIHDGGRMWDEWDRNGMVSVFDDEGTKRGIVPFITSYRTPCHWDVDVTHFRPYLAGKRRFEIAAGTTFYKNRGYLMSVSLAFYPGTPDLEPYRIVPLWNGQAHYGSAENHYQDFFPPQTVAIDEEAKAARLWMTVTGHSQVGEFTPSNRALLFRPAPDAPVDALARFESVLWKTDVYLNPNRPQFGTWQFSRAGWAPGDLVRPWEIDLTPHVQPGAEAELRYEPEPYDFGDDPRQPADKDVNAASQAVHSYLILYRDPTTLTLPPSLQVTNVADGSAAAEAGLKAGDFLATYDGRTLETVEDLRAALQTASGRETVPIVVFRGPERLELEIRSGRMGIGLGSR